MKLKVNLSYWLETFITTIFLFAIELIFRIIENYEIITWANLRIFLSCFLLAIIWNFIGMLFKGIKKRRIFNIFLLLIASVYGFAQAGFLNFIGIYMSFGTRTQLEAVNSYIKDFLLSIPLAYYLLFMPVIIYLAYIILTKKNEMEESNLNFKTILTFLITFIGGASLYYLTLVIPFMQNKVQILTNLELFSYPSNSGITVNQFGSTMYGILDLKLTIFPYYDYGITNQNIEEEEDNENARKIDDTAWKKLISETTDPVLNNLNNYFISRNIPLENEMTGYFKNKNLIIIMMESVNTIIDNKEYFPNFAKMMENGWYWENNFSPRNSCATINNEISGITSIFSLNQLCSGEVYKDNTYYQSLFNQFKNIGYNVTSYHDYDATYYDRRTIHQNLGVSQYYDVNDLQIPYDEFYAEWPSDAEFMEKITPMFAKNAKFMAWITTVSAHQPYGETSILGEQYFDYFDNPEYTEAARRYLSKVKVTDDALGVLMDELQKLGKLDDTVIVLYGDHYPYALKEEDLISLMGSDVINNNERDRIPFLIYNPKLKAKKFDQYTTYMNIAPTIANLFGNTYDPRLFLGEDLFDENYSNRAIFSDGSFEDKKAYYDAATSKITYKSTEEYGVDELKNINIDITNRIRMSNLAITNNYFDYLQKGIMKEKGEDK